MRNENVITDAPIISMVTLGRMDSEALRRLTRFASILMRARRKLLRRPRSVVFQLAQHSDMTTPCHSITANLNPSVFPDRRVAVLNRPPSAPDKPDEPLPVLWYVATSTHELWPKNPTVEIQFPQAVQQPAFP
jgi:hypothetical protein